VVYSKKEEHTTKMTEMVKNKTPLFREGPRGPPPALNPESCAVVQPYKDFIAKGFITKLGVEFGPMGNKVYCTVRSDLLSDGETKDTLVAVGDAKQRIIDKKLWVPGNRNSKSKAEPDKIAPKKSLCKEDFLLSDKLLLSRALAVAKELGDTTARGRIGSLKFNVDGSATIEEWWSDASVGEKSRLLSDKRHHDSFSLEQHTRLGELLKQCPFRGPLLTPPEEEEEEDAPASRSSASTPSNALVQKK